MRWSYPSRPAVVLGSTQRPSDIDEVRAASAGLEVVRRGTGGGAVLVRPGEQVWLDVWLPRGDPLWSDDVVRSAGWIGSLWAGALRDMGVDDVRVHSGRLSRSEWSDVVCFAGVGPGEVLAGNAKIVGVAQRRSREGAHFHTMAPLRWDPTALMEVMVSPPGVPQSGSLSGNELQDVATGLCNIVPLLRAIRSEAESPSNFGSPDISGSPEVSIASAMQVALTTGLASIPA